MLNAECFETQKGGLNMANCPQHFRVFPYLFYLCLSVFICGSTSSLSAQQKERVDLLVSGGTVITMDKSRRVLDDGAVAVRGDAIVAVGPRADLEAHYEASRRIDAHGTIILPGLINGHQHAPMVLFRGLADDLA